MQDEGNALAPSTGFFNNPEEQAFATDKGGSGFPRGKPVAESEPVVMADAVGVCLYYKHTPTGATSGFALVLPTPLKGGVIPECSAESEGESAP